MAGTGNQAGPGYAGTSRDCGSPEYPSLPCRPGRRKPSNSDLIADAATAGGGGDKVQYKPYKDMETGFYKMLSNVFAQVTKTKTAARPACQASYIGLLSFRFSQPFTMR